MHSNKYISTACTKHSRAYGREGRKSEHSNTRAQQARERGTNRRSSAVNFLTRSALRMTVWGVSSRRRAHALFVVNQYRTPRDFSGVWFLFVVMRRGGRAMVRLHLHGVPWTSTLICGVPHRATAARSYSHGDRSASCLGVVYPICGVV